MKKLFFLLFVINSAFTFGQTQMELNSETMNSFETADKELNEVYQKILIEYKSDTIFIYNLKSSQRIWIAFRDAELKMKYPEREPGWYGSMHSMCISGYLEKLTKERIKTLKEWLNGIEEGEGCGGSIKFKN
jgi:uncharacterized protein YecT (DUF1311 family)